jgi:hypothetical protein
MTTTRQNQSYRSGFIPGLRQNMIVLSMVILSPAMAIADETPGASDSNKAAEPSKDLASRPMPPEEEKKLGPAEAQEQDLLASRMMTPKEEERSGLAERLKREEEERKKQVALHLPSFAKLQPMLANIRDDQGPSVFEGLPHQVFHPERHASELKTKETLIRHGFAFYKTPIKPSAEDVRELNALMKHPDSFSPYMAINGPGGFQPDFSLVWENNGKPIEVQVCFSNGGEIKAHHDGVVVHCQMAEIKPLLKNLLAKYHKQLLEPEE